MSPLDFALSRVSADTNIDPEFREAVRSPRIEVDLYTPNGYHLGARTFTPAELADDDRQAISDFITWTAAPEGYSFGEKSTNNAGQIVADICDRNGVCIAIYRETAEVSASGEALVPVAVRRAA